MIERLTLLSEQGKQFVKYYINKKKYKYDKILDSKKRKATGGKEQSSGLAWPSACSTRAN